MTQKDFQAVADSLQPGLVIKVRTLAPVSPAQRFVTGTYLGRTDKHLLLLATDGERRSYYHTGIVSINKEI